MIGDLSAGIDWNDDKFICWDARPGDALNLISAPLDLYNKERNAFNGTGVYTTPGQYENFSQQYMKHVVIGSSNIAYYAIGSLTNAQVYTVSAWVKIDVSDPAMKLGIYRRTGGGDPGDPANYTIVGSTQTFTNTTDPGRLDFTFTAPATATYYLGFTIASGVSHGYLYAMMAILGTNTTQGYNTGRPTDLYEALDPNGASWNIGGGDEQTLIAPEGVATVKVDNTDKRYSPENVASPLYGYFNLNHILRVRVNDESDIPVIVWTGYVNEYNPDVTFNPGMADIHAIQGVFYLDRVISSFDSLVNLGTDYEFVTDLKTLFLGVVPTAGDRYEFILDQSPLDYSYISDQNNPTNYYVGINWWETAYIKLADMETFSTTNKTTVRDILTKALTVDRGFFCFDRAGFPAYFNYAHTWNYSDTPIDLIIGDGEASKGDYEYAKKLFNQAVISRTRGTTTSTTVELWRTRTSVKALRGKYKKPRKTIVTAVFKKEEGGDVIVDTVSAFGAGSTITVTTPGGATAPVAFYTATVVQNQGGAVITFTNQSTIDLTFIAVLNGTLKNNFGDYVTTYSNEANIAKSNVKEIRVSSDFIYDDLSADSLGEYLVWYLGQVNGTIRNVTIKWRTDEVIQKALGINVGTLLTITEEQTTQNAVRYQVIGESWRWTPLNLEQTLTLKRSYPVWIAEVSDMTGDVTLGYGN